MASTLFLTSLFATTAVISATVISASDPRVLVSGRASYNADGSRSFDWEGTSFTLTVNNSGSVSMNVTSSTSGLNRVISHVETGPGVWYEQTRQWVQPGTSVLLVAANLYKVNTVRVFFELEPAFSGTTDPDAFFTVNSFVLDAGDVITTAPLARRIEVVGDSISAGASTSGPRSARRQIIQLTRPRFTHTRLGRLRLDGARRRLPRHGLVIVELRNL